MQITFSAYVNQAERKPEESSMHLLFVYLTLKKNHFRYDKLLRKQMNAMYWEAIRN